ncbi:hypothetical protein HaLaN_19395 [Haematococcus lacustris]|uniref:Uncharacterized protein n=1 Tax=Haematococcus lacustris TaxID=44745 RepID=A0A699ZUM0_HAELA|nr:hypothetical protein HaLaN_19395 [Haematococcus lacustris]
MPWRTPCLPSHCITCPVYPGRRGVACRHSVDRSKPSGVEVSVLLAGLGWGNEEGWDGGTAPRVEAAQITKLLSSAWHVGGGAIQGVYNMYAAIANKLEGRK